MAKNDIFLRFAGSIGESSYLAIGAAFAGYGDWDGKEETFEASVVKLSFESGFDESFLEMVKAMLRLEAICAERNLSER